MELFGDVRMHAEYDELGVNEVEDENRDRLRYRARLGLIWEAEDDILAVIRLATNTKDKYSPHQNFELMSNDEGDFGLDRAYVTYTGIPSAKLIIGKAGLNYWKQSELFWDSDINPEALAGVYTFGDITVNGNLMILKENGLLGEDTKAELIQGVYKKDAFTVALGYIGYDAEADNGDEPIVKTTEFFHLQGQYRLGSLVLGIELMNSDADEEDKALVVQARYKITEKNELRAYYWSVEALAVHFTQDDMPFDSNFDGIELSWRHKLNDKANARLRIFQQDIKEDNLSPYADALRVHFDVNIKL